MKITMIQKFTCTLVVYGARWSAGCADNPNPVKVKAKSFAKIDAPGALMQVNRMRGVGECKPFSHDQNTSIGASFGA